MRLKREVHNPERDDLRVKAWRIELERDGWGAFAFVLVMVFLLTFGAVMFIGAVFSVL